MYADVFAVSCFLNTVVSRWVRARLHHSQRRARLDQLQRARLVLHGRARLVHSRRARLVH
eukprot:4930636-Pleurochrysis_carterae.AAC.1